MISRKTLLIEIALTVIVVSILWFFGNHHSASGNVEVQKTQQQSQDQPKIETYSQEHNMPARVTSLLRPAQKLWDEQGVVAEILYDNVGVGREGGVYLLVHRTDGSLVRATLNHYYHMPEIGNKVHLICWRYEMAEGVWTNNVTAYFISRS